MQEMKKVLLMECISITTFLQFLEVLYDDIYTNTTNKKYWYFSIIHRNG